VVQDALLAAWQQWPIEGVPHRPAAWLWTVARRRAVDVLRRDLRHREKVALLAWPAEQPSELEVHDDRLRLVFTCCHPALASDVRVALTLRTVCRLSTAEIASGFMVSEAAIVQRLTRGSRKIAAAGVPYRVPADDELGERLRDVLAVIYLLFNEAYLCSAADRPQRHDLSDDADWLTEPDGATAPTASNASSTSPTSQSSTPASTSRSRPSSPSSTAPSLTSNTASPAPAPATPRRRPAGHNWPPNWATRPSRSSPVSELTDLTLQICGVPPAGGAEHRKQLLTCRNVAVSRSSTVLLCGRSDGLSICVP
jgi:hypothetical protein